MVDYEAIGQRVRGMRRALKLTQGELAELVGISASFLGHIERGTRILSVDTLMALCDALGTTPNALLGVMAADALPDASERVTVSVASMLQGVSDLLRELHIVE
ncbi:MAG: helix-turn-helix transcriptional regulator [Clostridia bacterium]|nr:helix-turn-helix transcriptional regulator [Clostridia bacterium]